MSAARQKPMLAVLRDNKALFMHEIVLPLFAVFQAGQFFIALGITTSPRDSAEQKQLVIKPQIAVDKADIRQLQNIRV